LVWFFLVVLLAYLDGAGIVAIVLPLIIHGCTAHGTRIIRLNALGLQVTNNQRRNLREHLTHVVARFCTCFEEAESVLLCQGPSSLGVYFLLVVRHIRFVGYENLLNIWLSVSLNLF